MFEMPPSYKNYSVELQSKYFVQLMGFDQLETKRICFE